MRWTIMRSKVDIDGLLTLSAVAAHGGVTRAATALALSQSAVSHKILRLEERLSCKLLTRRAGAPILTDAGERLLGYADRILALHDEAVAALSGKSIAGEIRLGVTEDTTTLGLSRILARFANLHPKVDIRTHVAQSLTLARQIADAAIDLAVMQIFARETLPDDMVLDRERLVWVHSRDFDPNPDAPLPFISFDPNCFYRHWAYEAVTETPYRLRTVLECASIGGVRSAVSAGMGLALLNERHIGQDMVPARTGLPEPPDVAYVVRAPAIPMRSAVVALRREIETEIVQPTVAPRM
ncbi:MAG: LysR family transcriptional regulator [Alphaproteobacteria bacterium]|nr:LysR family transcriptional regulator [Alphaproteobacteria bacterium]